MIVIICLFVGLHDLQIQISTQSNVIEETYDAIDDKSSQYDDETTIHLSSNLLSDFLKPTIIILFISFIL